MLCHFSSEIFRSKMLRAAERAGAPLDGLRFFTNLHEKGNTGSASIFIMLDELFNSGSLEAGQNIVCMVPESGRFIVSFMVLEVVGGDGGLPDAGPDVLADDTIHPIGPETETTEPRTGLALKQELVRRLTNTWVEFETALNTVPVINRMNRGQLRMEDYHMILRNMRQQVVEGARWISRAASNITGAALELRTIFIGHAQDEHRDYRMLEENYVSVGGRLEDIVDGEKNIGSEALSAWMFHKSSRENPLDLLGAMFIIEGIGNRLAGRWAESIRTQLDLRPDQVSFLAYHADNDETHLDKLWDALDSGILTPELVDAIVKTAKVTARLYRLQIEEMDNT
jgi:3-oxoacyl-[acyl-carrier-protein] synthase-3